MSKRNPDIQYSKNPAAPTAGLSIILAFLLFPAAAKAQPWYFKHYGSDQGLAYSTVSAVCQDKEGFMWLGTRGGVYRFDGYRFRLFSITNGEPFTDQWIFSLITDRRGTLWAGTFNGLFYFDRQRETFIRAPAPPRVLLSLTADDNDNLWLVYQKQFCLYNIPSKKTTTYPANQWFDATSVYKAHDGSIWFYATDRQLRKYEPGRQTFTTYKLPPGIPPVVDTIRHAKIIDAGNDQLLIGAENQPLKLFNRKSGIYQEVPIYSSGKKPVFVKDLMQYGPDECWIATESGIFILSPRNGKTTHLYKGDFDPYSLSDNAVYALCKDTEGGVWAGTFFGGLNYYSPKSSLFKKYYRNGSANSIIGNVVREICQDQYGQIWFGTEDGGLNKLNPHTGAIQQFKPTGEPTSLSYRNIHGLLPAGNDLWVGTFFNGLNILDIRTGKVRKRYWAGPGPGDLKSDFALCIYRTRSGQILVGTSNGVFRYLPENDQFAPLQGIPGNIIVKNILEDSFGGLWVSTADNGLYYLASGKSNAIHYTSGKGKDAFLPAPTVNTLTEDHHRNIWISTENGGLLVLDSNHKKIRHYTTGNILPSNFVFKAIEDAHYGIWIITDNGLVYLNPQNGQTSLFTKADGLLDNQFNYNSGFRDHEGTLYFGSLSGMITFDPQRIRSGQFIPPLYITGFQQGNKEFPVSATSSFTLPYYRSSFSINFAALNYTTPETIQYAYQMQGLDTGWTHLKNNRKVYFTSLAPGNYVFKVRATRNGSVIPSEKQLIIRITPPFYATGWAYACYVLLAAGLLYMTVRYYKRRARILQERAIYHANMDFFTNVAHEIKTPLALINGPVENLLEKAGHIPAIQKDLSLMSRNLKRLMALMNQVLDFRKTETRHFKLTFSRVNISGVLKEVYQDLLPLFTKKGLSVQLDPAFDTGIFIQGDEEALQKIVTNLFSNAAKYGEKQFIVRLEHSANDQSELVIRFMNDGALIPSESREKIFTPFYRLKAHAAISGSGIGLTLARSLAELHGGSLELTDERNGYNNFILKIPRR